MSDGSNAAKGLPGYKKVMSQPYLSQLWDAAPPAPPDLPHPDYAPNPLTDPAHNEPPPQPDRYLRDLSRCGSCGAVTGFNVTDAAKCPNCSDAQRITGGLTAPGTPWF